jgi:4-oxalocrotonate tautomerase
MPYVNIKVTKDGVTAEQKQRLIAGVTQLLVDVLDKDPRATVVVIDEVDTDNWGMNGQSVTVLRSKAKKD